MNPALSPHDLHQQLWKEFSVTRAPHLRQQLATLYLNLVHAIAGQVARTLPPYVDLGDLVQEGYLGLHRAIGTFDSSFNVKFTTYASSAIRGAMLDSLRRAAWAPRGARQRASDIDDARHVLLSRLERPPSDEEIAGSMGISTEEYQRIALDSRIATQVSIWSSEGRPTAEGRKGESRQILPPDARVEDPALAAQRQDLRELLLKGFERDERLIVILYYFECMSMKEIGETLGISESRISQKHSLIVERIKAALSSKLHEFV